MDEGRARTLLERLECRRIHVYGDEIMSSCPHPENHPRGDRRPSFSARISDSDKSPYVCYGCHEKGTLEWLAIHTGNADLVPDWKPRNVDKNLPWIPVPSTNAGAFSHLVKKKRPVLFKDDYLEPFIGRLSSYMIKRGITLDTARLWELGVDRPNSRATFTVRDYQGRLAVVIGRDVSNRSKVKYSNYVLDMKNKMMVPFIDHSREKDFKSPTKKFFVYGEHIMWKVLTGELERDSEPHLLVVEGAIDVLKLWQLGYNAVAVLGSAPSDFQMEKIVSLLPREGRLVIMADGDKAGKKLTSQIGRALHERVPTFVASLPEGSDPGDADDDTIELAFVKARLFSLTDHG